MDDDLIFNGIDGLTGEYLVPPITAAEAVRIAQGRPPEGSLGTWLRAIVSVLRRPKLGLPMDVDPTNLSRAGWAIVFPFGISAEVKAAVQPLLDRRKSLVPPDRCKVLEYRPGESMKKWLQRQGVAPGSVTPTKAPYYITLVGGPRDIPFDFQYLLDVEYAVGRLAFDTPEQYRSYAEGVVAYETASGARQAKEVAFWGPRHPADRATQMSADALLGPLADGVPALGDQPAEPPVAAERGYRSRCFRGGDATKARLLETLHPTTGTVSPAVLFTASHGMGWPKGDPRQRQSQGALLCQDWSGFGQISPAHYVTAAEIESGAKVSGLIAFLFACYGAGTPQTDNFLSDRGRGPVEIAEESFVAALPQRLLSHPGGPALAVVGHVERAWGYSIRPFGAGAQGPNAQGAVGQIGPFRDFLARVLAGQPVGHATKNFSERYAVLSSELLSQLDESNPGPRPTPQEIAATWVERNDAQNYVLLGDPAVRLRAELLS